MAKSSNSKRSRSRPRGNGRRGGGGGGGRGVIDSNGPEVRVRGTAQQVLDKYLTLARDASGSGDRVLAENYLQHADHYYRVIHGNEPPQRNRSRDNKPGADEAGGDAAAEAGGTRSDRAGGDAAEPAEPAEPAEATVERTGRGKAAEARQDDDAEDSAEALSA